MEWALRPGKRRRLVENLGHAVGRPPRCRAVGRLVRREIVNEARRSADLLWALGRPEEFLDSLELSGIDHLVDAGAAGRGLVLVGLHLGGWELAGVVPATLLPVPATALVADDWLAWAIEARRARAGLQSIARTSPARRIGDVLRRGEALIILGDDGTGPPPRTSRVRFLDAEADLPSGAVTLARLFGAPLIGFRVLPLGRRRWSIEVDPPITPIVTGPQGRDAGAGADRALLQTIVDRWTSTLRDSPEHWAAPFPIRWHHAHPDGDSESSISS